MKALSLMQPWASLVAVGAKRIETRSWSTKYRGPIAIHASKHLPSFLKTRTLLTAPMGIYDALEEVGITTVNQLPLGAVVAVANLVSVQQIPQGAVENTYTWAWEGPDGRAYNFPLTERETVLGDYTPMRYAWLLEDVQAVGPILGVKGSLGLWNFTSVFLPDAPGNR